MGAIPKKRAGTTTTKSDNTTEKKIGDKKYIVKSVFVGEQDIKTALLNLAERKTIKEMGIDIAIP